MCPSLSSLFACIAFAGGRGRLCRARTGAMDAATARFDSAHRRQPTRQSPVRGRAWAAWAPLEVPAQARKPVPPANTKLTEYYTRSISWYSARRRSICPRSIWVRRLSEKSSSVKLAVTVP